MRVLFVNIIGLVLLYTLPFSQANAQETVPGNACAAGELNHIRQVGGPETTGFWHLMRCNGSTWNQYISILADGSVGVGGPPASGRPLRVIAAADTVTGLSVLSAASAQSGIGIALGALGNSSQAHIVAYRAPANSLDSSLRFETRSGGTTAERMRIHENGFVGIGDPAPNAALDVDGDIEFTGSLIDMSDRRLKYSITPLLNQLEKVVQLRPVSFVMKDDPKQRVELGLIAQDVEPIFPELVGDSNGMKSMSYLGLIAPVIGAVQELKAENAALRRDYDNLSKRLEIFEGTLRPPLKPYNE